MTCELGGGVDARMAVDGEPGRVLREALRPHRVAEPPSGHGERLAPAVEEDHAVRDLGVGEEARVLAAVVDDAAVDLVAQHHDLGMLREARRELVDLALRDRPAGRVGGRVEDDEAGRGGDVGEHRVGVEGEVLALEERDRDRFRAAVLDDRLVDGKAGVGVHDFRAGLPEHEDREEHRDLAARHDHNPRRVHLHPAAGRDIRRDRLAKGGDPGGGGVAVVAVAKGLDRRLDDVGRGLEVGLADAEVDDVAPAARELLGPGQDLERGLGPEMGHPFAQLRHTCFLVLPPLFRARSYRSRPGRSPARHSR